MTQIEKMFAHDGKTTKRIGPTRAKIYKELYQYISEKQKNNELPFNGNYLGDNELAQNIYQKKLNKLREKLQDKTLDEETLNTIIHKLNELQKNKKNLKEKYANI